MLPQFDDCGAADADLPVGLPLPKMLPKESADLLVGARLKNTFLEFTDEEDSWVVKPDPRRQHTDSILDRSSHSLSAQLEQNIIDTLQGHLSLNRNPQSSAAPFAPGLQRQELLAPRPKQNFESQVRGAMGEDCVDQQPFETKFEAARIQQQQVLTAALAANGQPHPGLANPSMASLMEKFQINGDYHMQQPMFQEPMFEALEEDENPSQEVDPEVQARRDLAAAGGGISGCTSIMVRHIPCKYTQRKLMREINSAGFLGRYDFFYLPMDPRSHANRGFAFLNFVNAEVAEDFYRMFHGSRLKHFNSEKVIAVMPADLQGFEQNASHYAASRALRRKRAQHSKPLFFRPLPAHLVPDDSIEVLLDQPIFVGPMNDMTSTCNWGQDVVKATKAATEGSAGRQQRGGGGGYNQLPHEVGLLQPGYRQTQASSKKPSFCPFCGHQRQTQHLFCPYCGGQFNE